MDRTGTDTERCVISELLALKDAPDDELLDQVEVIGERTARHMLFDEATRLQHRDLPTATDCAALADRIDALIRPA
jgi:Holliday junction resolvasome RuvABC DNA-binding subunit